MDLVRIGLIVLLALIVISLGMALFQLSRSEGDSSRLLRALTWRIALSVALFALLMLAWYLGLISPHGLLPVQGAPR